MVQAYISTGDIKQCQQIQRSVVDTYINDFGLMHAVCVIYAETAMGQYFTAIFKGAVAEQFAGQELLVNQSPYTKAELFYWGRQAKSSTAEIDYLIEKNGEVIPVEVKSGAIGNLKSQQIFIQTYQSKRALKISQAPFYNGYPVISLPFFVIEGFFRQEE